MAEFYLLTYCGAADALIECGDYVAVKVDAAKYNMAVRMWFVEVPGYDVLGVGDSHSMQPFIDKLRHEAVAMFFVGGIMTHPSARMRLTHALPVGKDGVPVHGCRDVADEY